jgi:hypothetical protein
MVHSKSGWGWCEFDVNSFFEQKRYTFGPNPRLAHYFCGTCGASCMAKSVEAGFFDDMVCVNVRIFEEGEEVWKGVARRMADGAAL